MTEQELRAEIHKRATVLKERAQEIAAISQWGPLDEALEAAFSKLLTVSDEAWEARDLIRHWQAQQKAERNGA